MKQNNSGIEHVERIGVLVGVCLPHCSLEWYHDKVIEIREIKKEMLHQQNCLGVRLVVYGA